RRDPPVAGRPGNPRDRGLPPAGHEVGRRADPRRRLGLHHPLAPPPAPRRRAGPVRDPGATVPLRHGFRVPGAIRADEPRRAAAARHRGRDSPDRRRRLDRAERHVVERPRRGRPGLMPADLLQKPAGVTATTRDRHAETTVLDLIPTALVPDGGRLYPVGRLDQDSEGLLILTNDGAWSERVLHPRYGVEREYALAVRRQLDRDQVQALGEGIALEEGLATFHHLRLMTAVE